MEELKLGGDSTPQTPAIPVDPNLATEQAQAEADLTRQLQTESRGDMTNLMALYGTRLALSASNKSPLSPSPATSKAAI